jgi:transposase InsO family protein
VRYGFIRDHSKEFHVENACRVLNISASGYYAWSGRCPSEREIDDARLIDKIRGVYDASDGVYGVRRVHRQLVADGESCSRNRVARLMRKCGIKARRRRKYRVTTDSKHSFPVAENLLNREFFSAGPNHVWVSDITYIWTLEGWLYLAAVIDLHSRMVVGWSMSERLDRSLALDALSMAAGRRNPEPGLIHHSDRGIQYASNDYQAALMECEMRCSMSRKGDCWDNAVAESFFSTLKTERVHLRLYRSRTEARRDIFEYIEVFYNRVRLHSTLGYLSPAQFESRALARAA